MTIHAFDVEIATEYGWLEAIILNSLWYWITKNRANEANFHDGKYWTHNSIRAFVALFPYATYKQIRGALLHLREEGIIEVGNYNKTAYDRTLWYTLSDKGEALFRSTHKEGASAFSEQRNSICQKRKKDLPKREITNSPSGKYLYSSVYNPVYNPINNPIKTNVDTAKAAPTFALEAKKLAELLHKLILENKPNRKIDKHWETTWADSIDKLHRIDKREWIWIKKVMEWSQQSDFWKFNILSGQKLRQKFETLEDQMQRENESKPEIIDLNNL